MRFLNLKFKNLNSLYGEWEIDFADLEQSGGIFSITGPTGSGKTTILDAVCLALYGSTPRLGRIKGKGSEIISKNTDECYSELTFQTYTGAFRAVWRQKRSGNGELKTIQGVYDIKNGTLSEHKVEEITGINFANFERSVLLAQGKFTAFLYANQNEKAAILETLTDAEIYRRISSMVYRRKEKEQEELDRLRYRVTELNKHLLSLEDETGLEQADLAGKARIGELQKQLDDIREKVNIAKAVEKLRLEIEELNRQTLELEKEEKAFTPNKMKLGAGERAALVVNTWRNTAMCRERLAKDEADKARLICSLSEAEVEASDLEMKLKSAEENYKSAEEELLRTEPKIRETQSLDYRILQHEKDIKILEKEIAGLKNNLFAAAQDKNGIRAKMDSIALTYREKAEENQREIAQINAELFELTAGTPLKALSAMKDEYLLKAGLNEHRERLEDGSPCPLCGSLAHPYHGLSGEFKSKLDNLESLINKAVKLEERKSKLAEIEKDNRNHLEKELAIFSEREKALLEAIKKDSERLEDKTAEARGIQPALEKLKKDRFELLGDKTPETEENRLKKAKDEGDRVLKAVQLARHDLSQKFTKLKTSSEMVSKSIEDNKKALEASESELREKLAKQSFNDLEEFKNAILPEAELAILKDKDKELTDRRKEIEIKREIKNKEARENEKSMAGLPPLKELEKNAVDLDRERVAEAEKIGNISRQLAENREIKGEAEKRMAEADIFQKSIKKWFRLNELIGSANGDKFARAIQTLLFGDLINKANTELLKISNRYQLMHGENLEILVADCVQNYWTRSARNLSGGESFIVSLALALALSNLSSSKTYISALFLDEGFGTLDSDYAETTITALATVQQRKKLIGLISHLDILREKIAYQINVEPIGGGKSVLTGSGVKKIAD
jgi:exonuclease SbcC